MIRAATVSGKAPSARRDISATWPMLSAIDCRTVVHILFPDRVETAVMSSLDLARAQLAAVFAHDWAYLDGLYDPEVRYLDPDGELVGRAAVTGRIRELSDALPECTYQVRHSTVDGDAAIVEWTLALGDDLRLNVATAYESRDGRIVVERNYWDNAVFAPAPAGDA
jgi:ketosteroid isomerase-like protein